MNKKDTAKCGAPSQHFEQLPVASNAAPPDASFLQADDLDTDQHELPDEELLYDLADLFRMFSDTTRIRILYSLMYQELCVAEIAKFIGSSQSAVSHQLRTLKQAHLVRFKRDGRNIRYSLADNHVVTILDQGLSHICE